MMTLILIFLLVSQHASWPWYLAAGFVIGGKTIIICQGLGVKK